MGEESANSTSRPKVGLYIVKAQGEVSENWRQKLKSLHLKYCKRKNFRRIWLQC
jgi:hypothetical protein